MKVAKNVGFHPAQAARILVRGPNWVGDAVLAMPALANLRKVFPQAKIALLAKPWVSELFEGSPDLDEVILYQDQGRHRGVVGKLRLAAELRRWRFDLAILFQNAFEAALLAFLAGIPHRIGYDADGRGPLLTVKVQRDREILRRHQMEYYLGLLQAVGLDRGERDFVFPISGEQEARAWELLRAEGIRAGEVLIGLNPGSAYGGAKRWLEERYAMLADWLQIRLGAKVLLFGSSRDAPIAERIQALMRSRSVNLAGRTSLRLLAALLRRCRVLVSNDTGVIHIAAAVGTPVVAIFGPTDPNVTAPLGPMHQIISHPPSCAPCFLRECPIDHRCMTAISVEEVLKAVERSLSSRQPPDSGHQTRYSMLDVRCSMVNRLPTSNTEHRTSNIALTSAVFLDRDGTVNEEVGYLKCAEELRLLPMAAEALRLLGERGFKRIIVSNQSGVGRGYLSEAEVAEINRHLLSLLAEQGSGVDGIYYCPHHPEAGCSCRKPKGGLVERAAREGSVDLARSYVVGDKRSDVLLAKNLGMRSILVLTGYGRQELEQLRERGGPLPDYVAEDLYEAVRWIVRDARG